MVTEDIVGKSNIYESGLIKYHLSIFVFFLILNKTLCRDFDLLLSACKIVRHGCIYLWRSSSVLGGKKSLKTPRKVEVQILAVLDWTLTDDFYLGLNARNGKRVSMFELHYVKFISFRSSNTMSSVVQVS